MIKNQQSQKGFTLIELIVYIAIASLVLVSALNIGWNVSLGQTNSSAKKEVYLNARLILNELQNQIRQADGVITANSVFNTNPGTLSLDYPGGNADVVFNTYSKAVNVGGAVTNITKLRVYEGMNYSDLTSDQVDVTNFTVQNLQRGTEKTNIGITLTLERVNPGNDPKYDASINIQTAISLRK